MLENTIVWEKDDFSVEQEEFERTIREFDSSRKRFLTHLAYLKEKYYAAPVTELSKEDWKAMQNTDSWDTTTRKKIQMAMDANNEVRDLTRVSNQFAAGRLKAPIAIRLADNSLYLVAGNTRLMMARVLKVSPKIVIVPTDW